MPDVVNPKTTTPVRKGDIFTITTGCYSDYTIDGVFRAREDFNPDALLADYGARFPEQQGRYKFEEAQFVAELVRLQIIEQVEGVREWHLGDYGDWSATADMPDVEN